MSRLLPSSLWTLCYAAALSGCGPRAAVFPTTDQWPDAKRQADGVAVDPLPAGVAGVLGDRTTAHRDIALTAPMALESAPDVARDFIAAVVREDAAALSALLGDRAIVVNPGVSGRPQSPLLSMWRERFRRFDYTALANLPVIREPELTVDTFEDLDAAVPGRPRQPAEMRPGDVRVHGRVVTPRIGSDRLFGDELTFLMRPEKGRYRIVLIFEEFQLP